MGTNGAGKSTFSKVVCGFEKQQSGTITFTGCEPLPYGGRYSELYSIASFNRVGTDEPGTDVAVIEKDPYGRVLFEVSFSGDECHKFYQTENYDDAVFAYVISQKKSGKKTYYYEDVCFVLCRTRADFTNEMKSRLQIMNDWGEPSINEGKLSSRSIIGARRYKTEYISFTTSEISERERSADRYSREGNIEIGIGDSLASFLLDVDSEGRSLFVEVLTNKDSGFVSAYFLILLPDGSYDKTTAFERIDDVWNYGEQLSGFKEKNSWAG